MLEHMQGAFSGHMLGLSLQAPALRPAGSPQKPALLALEDGSEGSPGKGTARSISSMAQAAHASASQTAAQSADLGVNGAAPSNSRDDRRDRSICTLPSNNVPLASCAKFPKRVRCPVGEQPCLAFAIRSSRAIRIAPVCVHDSPLVVLIFAI